VRPVDDAGDETVFDLIDVDVIDTAREVVLIAYRVLPIAVLPEPVAAFCIGHQGEAAGHGRAGKMTLYAAPSIWVIGIVFRQGQNGVQMVGLNDNGGDSEGGGRLRCTKCGAEGACAIDERAGTAVGQSYGEDVGAAGEVVAPIAHHGMCPP